MAFESKIRPIYWEDGKSKMIDQTVIPYEYKYIEITSGDDMFNAIRNMIVRGAPAIGIAGAQGIVLYAQALAKENYARENFVSELIKENLHLSEEEYQKLVQENVNKPITEIEPKKYQEKIVKALATINSQTRYGSRSYNEMYISNPEVMAVYAYPPGNDIGDTMKFVDNQKQFIKDYAVEKDIPMYIFGD